MKTIQFSVKNITLFITALVLLMCGCAKAPPKGPIVFHPSEKAMTPEKTKAGYRLDKRTWIYETKTAIFRVTHISEADGNGAGFPLGDDLLTNGYVVFKMEMENRSKTAKMLFNPAQAVLVDDAMDYKKPLDYTDFYEMVSSSDDPESNLKLSDVKERFYDLSITVKPGAKISKLLVFGPLEKGITWAELGIKEVYAGTASLRLSFPFVLKYAKLPEKDAEAKPAETK